ncbi:MAG: hypothetical protein IPK82_33255 [Polyangiaceae bacterium]|nr:hypothetical protein [Polyangiaceae bacterium]
MNSERSTPDHLRAKTRTSMTPGVLIGAALGFVVGAVWLLFPAEPTQTPNKQGSGVSTQGTSPILPADTSSLHGATSASAQIDAALAVSEAEYLKRAESLVTSAPADALALIEAHPTKFPSSERGREREMIAVTALAALGRKQEARARARILLALFPNDADRARLQAIVDVGPPEKLDAL